MVKKNKILKKFKSENLAGFKTLIEEISIDLKDKLSEKEFKKIVEISKNYIA